MRFLTRPVTADQSCYGAGDYEYCEYYQCSLHHMRVPLILPSTSDTAIAVMNMPAMMYTRSMLQHVYAQPGTERYYYDPEIERSHTSIYATDVGFDRAV